jgi:hypothetical protein
MRELDAKINTFRQLIPYSWYVVLIKSDLLCNSNSLFITNYRSKFTE